MLNEEKRAKLADTLARRQRASGATGASIAAPSPTPSILIAAVHLAVAQASPAPPPLEEDKGVVEIESDEDFVEGPMTATTSHSSTVSRPA